MLQTLLKMGQSAGGSSGKWDDLLKVPWVKKFNKKGELPVNYCLPVCFDLDNGTVTTGKLSEYVGLDSARRWFNLAVASGNTPCVYVCVDGRKNMGQFTKTFFGRNPKEVQGEMLAALGKYPGLNNTVLAEVLKQITELRNAYLSLAANEKGIITLSKLTGDRKLAGQVVLVYAQVKATALGLAEFTPFVQIVASQMQAISGYAEFVQARFQPPQVRDSMVRLCYATGERCPDVMELDIASRYSLNGTFVKSTLHYAPLFARKCFAKNYQVSDAAQLLLERGSKLLLDNCKIRIAGVNHVLLPRSFGGEAAGENGMQTDLPRLLREADLLFQFQDKTTCPVYEPNQVNTATQWVSFLGFESDGNFFKITNHIGNVHQPYFSLLLASFMHLDAAWQQSGDLPWQQIMGPRRFNLFTVYGLVPVRKDQKNRNAALLLFKQILERRPTERRTWCAHFRDLVLCHRYRHYAVYGNVNDKNADGQLSVAQAFDFAVRSAVYQFLALFTVLTELQLLLPLHQRHCLEPSNIPAIDTSTTLRTQSTKGAFFDRMQYQGPQKALFYLGRALNKVARVEYAKGLKSKPIMDKLTYSGMNVEAIIQLSKVLTDKGHSFRLSAESKNNPDNDLDCFALYFKSTGWSMPPEEALFFILSGYVFTSKMKSTPSLIP
ncbi:TM1802 family CRISPR-associated protein [Hymenobacter arizonensis]|uniref:CRISPR-associated protein TM1802 (Cas_TM1802) n=1 Tax=Hymenobacter arizonensis TaxID=1227077 RepID=A0A1I6BGR9_HYMAR|nr:TM1802 family CRISPR-associated protein [Hymenobacter arizonensis]SFQ80140.1 CRISPR-associated protein TM1802 (cas_TM1802) [Hymenobacter arizonensis]